MNFLSVNPGFYIGNVHVAWYGLIMACSMALGVVLCYFFAKRRALKSTDLLTVALYTLPFAVIGARVFYVLFNPSGRTYSFVDAFKIWKGGMSIWGGVIGGAIGVTLCCLIHKKDFLSVCDVIAPALILAQSTGRWGNFINKEAHGWEIFDPKYFGLPFSVEINGHFFLATFLYEAILNTIGFAVLVFLLYKSKKRGLILSGYLMWYGVVRSVIETFRTDQMLIGSLPFSQLTSIISACIGFALLIYILVRDYKKKKRGINPNEYFNLRLIANNIKYEGNKITVSLGKTKSDKNRAEKKPKIAVDKKENKSNQKNTKDNNK